MKPSSKITTDLLADEPLEQDANYRFDAVERQYVDNQILGTQQHVADSLINGAHCTFVTVDPNGTQLVTGDVVCLAGSLIGVPTIVKATLAALVNAKSVFGVVMDSAAPNTKARVAIGGVLHPTVTGLAAVAGVVRCNTTTGRCERVAAFADGDYIVGAVDPQGYMSIEAGAQFSSAGGGGGGATISGTDGEVVTKSGANGVTAANVTAGSSYIGIGSGTLATSGLVRTAYNASASRVIVATVHSDTTQYPILKSGLDTVEFGDNTGVTIANGASISLRVAGNEKANLAAGAGDYIKLGATPATAGFHRLPSAGTIQFRNAADSANIIGVGTDASDNITIGCDAALTGSRATTVEIYPVTAVYIGANNTTSLGCAADGITAWQGVIKMGPGASGAAATGNLRLRNADTIVARNSANSADYIQLQFTSTNHTILGDSTAASWGYLDISQVGASMAAWVWNGAALVKQFECLGTTMDFNVPLRTAAANTAGTGAVRMANAQQIKHRNAANSADIETVSVDSSNRMVLGDGAAYMRLAAALGGHSQAGTPTALKLRVNALSLAANTSAVTLATTEYECPVQRFTGTGGVDKRIVFPNHDGAIWVIDNQSSNSITVGVNAVTGGTAIGAGLRCWIYCDGTDVRKLNTPV